MKRSNGLKSGEATRTLGYAAIAPRAPQSEAPIGQNSAIIEPSVTFTFVGGRSDAEINSYGIKEDKALLNLPRPMVNLPKAIFPRKKRQLQLHVKEQA